MSGYTVSGRLDIINNTEYVGQKGDFAVRKCVVETIEQYPQYLQVQFVKDKTEMLDSFQEGDEVDIQCNVRGRKWKDGAINTFEGWKITSAGSSGGQSRGKSSSGSGSNRQGGGSQARKNPHQENYNDRQRDAGTYRQREIEDVQDQNQNQNNNQIDDDLPF